MSLTLALLLAGSATEPSECRAALATEWPELVDRLDDPVGVELTLVDAPDPKKDSSLAIVPDSVRRAIGDAERLGRLCEADPEARARLRSYEASQRLRIEDYAGAYRLLADQPVDARSPLAGADAATLLLAAGGVGVGEYRQAATAVRSAHREAAVALGLAEAGSTQTSLGWIDGYRIAGARPERILIAWPDAGMPLTLRIPEAPDKDSGEDARVKGCSVETAPRDAPSLPMSDAAALSYAETMFHATRVQPIGGWRPRKWEDIGPDCTSLNDLLFAFGPPTQLIGNEFSASSALSSKHIMRMLAGSIAQKARAVDAVIARPEIVAPVYYLQVVGELLQRGDPLQATFLYYIWGVRFAPWAKLGSPSDEGALFGAARATFGPGINGWIGSDPMLNRQVLERALTYERKLPLHPDRPKGVDEQTWLRTIEEVREGAAREWLGQMPVTPDALKAWAKRRSENGLPNGPVEHPGAPLPDHWQ